MDNSPSNFIKMRLLSFVSGLIFLLLTPVVVYAGDSSRSWCEVTDEYIVVEDKLFDSIVSFTENKGKRHFLYTVTMVELRMNPYS